MPSIKISSIFLFCMLYKASARKSRVWDSPHTSIIYGLSHAPSRRDDVPVLRGLTRQSMKQMAEFIDAIEKLEVKERATFIDYKKKDDPWAVHRAVWMVWYRSFSAKVNSLIDGALRDNDCLPHQRMRAMELEKFPPADTCSRCPDELARALFGDDILSGDQVGPDIENVMKTMVSHAMASRYQKKYNVAMNVLCGVAIPSRQRRKKDQKQAPNHLGLLQALAEKFDGSDDIQLDDLREGLRLVRRVKPYIMWQPLREDTVVAIESTLVAFAEKQQLDISYEAGQIHGDMQAMEMQERATKTIRKVRGKRFRSDLMGESDLKRLLAELVDHFAADNADGVAPDQFLDEECSAFDNDGDRAEDIGVTTYKTTPLEELHKLLAFENGRPLQFNKFRGSDGMYDAWEDEKERFWENGGEGMVEIHAQWHQLSGVCSILDKVFLDYNAPVKTSHLLIADDVGLGKTMEIMMVLAFLMQVYVCEENADIQKRPPLVSSVARASFMGMGRVPNLPHLIVVPNAVIAQWHREMRAFFKPKTLEIHIVNGNEAQVDSFFASPAWQQSTTPMIFRVILMQHSTFAGLSGSRFDTKKSRKGAEPDTLPMPKGISSARAHTIFTMQWCIATIDEIHEFRGDKSRPFMGVLALSLCARLVLGATATPMVSQPRARTLDALNIGRMLRIPGLSGRDAINLQTVHNRYLGQARRGQSEESKRAQIEALETYLTSATAASTLEPPGDPVTAAKYFFVCAIKDKLKDHMIRRTSRSLKPDGDPINAALPPKTEIAYIITLSQDEMAELTQELAHVSKAHGNFALFAFEKFFVKYRMYLACPIAAILDDDSDTESDDEKECLTQKGKAKRKSAQEISWPTFADQEAFEHDAGSKLQHLITLVKYHLAGDNRAPARPSTTTPGEMELPDIETPEDPQAMQKVMVYYNFTCMTQTFQSAFHVNGIKAVFINGALPPRERETLCAQFKQDPTIRVLCATAIYGTGINITEACHLIHFDVMWSGVFQQQINGRIWRYGQKHPVTIYHLIACRTTDIVMNGMASEKNTLMSALVKAGKNTVLEKFREQEDLDEGDALEDAETEIEVVPAKIKDQKKVAKTSKANKPKKITKVMATMSRKRARDEENDEEKDNLPTAERPPPTKKASSSKFGLATTVSHSDTPDFAANSSLTETQMEKPSSSGSSKPSPSTPPSASMDVDEGVTAAAPSPHFFSLTAQHSHDSLDATATQALHKYLPTPPQTFLQYVAGSSKTPLEEGHVRPTSSKQKSKANPKPVIQSDPCIGGEEYNLPQSTFTLAGRKGAKELPKSRVLNRR